MMASTTDLYWLTVFSSTLALLISIIHREFTRSRLSWWIGAAWLFASFLTLAAYGYHASRQILHCNQLLEQQEHETPSPPPPQAKSMAAGPHQECREWTIRDTSGKQITLSRRTNEH